MRINQDGNNYCKAAVATVILEASALTLILSRQEPASVRKCLIALAKIIHSITLGEQD